jgi:hypothetical protein
MSRRAARDPGSRCRTLRTAVAGILSLAGLVIFAPAAPAQTLNGFVELQGTRVDESNTVYPLDLPPLTIETHTTSWLGRLNFVYDHRIWPNVSFQVGGLFEGQRGKADVAGLSSEGILGRLLPYAILRWQTPTNLAEIGWQRNEVRAGPSWNESRRLIRDTYGLVLGWYPEAASFIRLSYYRSDDRDDTRKLLDQQLDRFLATAGYRPIDALRFDYRGSWSWLDDQRQDSEVDSVNQNARVNYGDSYWNGRLMLSASYDVSWREATTRRQSPGEVELPVTANRGLSALSDQPANVTLTPNAALIDGNREASAGILLDPDPASGDRRLRNIGLDFEIPRAVNALRLWVGRRLEPEVARTFSWEIWSSADNVRWTRQRTLGSAPFAPFDNYFELRFTAIAARYLKVVVAPLAPGVQDPAEYQTIFVTELEALLFRDVPGGEVTVQSNEQRVYAGAQVLLANTPNLTWDVNYVANFPDGKLANDTLANVLSLSHRFNPTWLVNARVAYETGRTYYGRRNAELWGASVTATPIPTLSATLSASGSRDRYERGVDQDNDSIYLNATANLYRGVNLLLGGGFARSTFYPGPTVDTRTGHLGIELDPHPTTSIYLGVDRIRDQRSGGGEPPSESYLDSSEISLSWTPVPSFYLFGSYRIEKSNQLPDTRHLTTTSVNWSPFPLGTLKFSFRYEEYYDSLLDSQTRIYGPGLRWYLNPISYLDVYWEWYGTESTLQRLERETLAATLRIGF